MSNQERDLIRCLACVILSYLLALFFLVSRRLRADDQLQNVNHTSRQGRRTERGELEMTDEPERERIVVIAPHPEPGVLGDPAHAT